MSENTGISAVPRFLPTIWHPEGIEAACAGADALLRRGRPRAVQLHTWTPGLVAPALRRVLGDDLQIVVGIGVDGIARDVTKGRASVLDGIKAFVRLAQRANICGAVALMHNAEAHWKRPPTSPERSRLREVIRGALAEIAARYPALVQLHTAYDHPSYHATYPWEAWLGEGSPIVASFVQVYADPGDGLMAARGALPAREGRALASWGAAVRAGWIKEDNPSTAAVEGVAWRPYYQAHHVPARDTVASALRHENVSMWAVPSRADRDGRSAFLALCELDRGDMWSLDALKGFQRTAGLNPDGVYGPLTEAALIGSRP